MYFNQVYLNQFCSNHVPAVKIDSVHWGTFYINWYMNMLKRFLSKTVNGLDLRYLELLIA